MAGRTVTIELGGKERELRLDLNAIAAICDKLNLTGRLNNLAEDLLGKPLPISAIRTLLWAALLWNEPDLTEEEVGSWVGLDNFTEVYERFFTLFGGKLSENAAGQVQALETAMAGEISDSPTLKS